LIAKYQRYFKSFEHILNSQAIQISITVKSVLIKLSEIISEKLNLLTLRTKKGNLIYKSYNIIFSLRKEQNRKEQYTFSNLLLL